MNTSKNRNKNASDIATAVLGIIAVIGLTLYSIKLSAGSYNKSFEIGGLGALLPIVSLAISGLVVANVKSRRWVISALLLGLQIMVINIDFSGNFLQLSHRYYSDMHELEQKELALANQSKRSEVSTESALLAKESQISTLKETHTKAEAPLIAAVSRLNAEWTQKVQDAEDEFRGVNGKSGSGPNHKRLVAEGATLENRLREAENQLEAIRNQHKAELLAMASSGVNNVAQSKVASVDAENRLAEEVQLAKQDLSPILSAMFTYLPEARDVTLAGEDVTLTQKRASALLMVGLAFFLAAGPSILLSGILGSGLNIWKVESNDTLTTNNEQLEQHSELQRVVVAPQFQSPQPVQEPEELVDIPDSLLEVDFSDQAALMRWAHGRASELQLEEDIHRNDAMRQAMIEGHAARKVLQNV